MSTNGGPPEEWLRRAAEVEDSCRSVSAGSMTRSTLEIIIAVQESAEVSHEELRLALAALSGIGQFIANELDKLVEAVEEKPAGVAKLRASFAKDTRERMFQAMKKPPGEWLGPRFTPGTPEQAEGLRQSKAIAKAAGIL